MTFQPRELSPGRSARDLFGAEIRRCRERSGMSLKQLSDVLKYSKSHLSRIENAQSLPYSDLPPKLDACFGTDGHFDRLYAVARNEPFPGKYRRAVEIESQAVVIEGYASATVPGLLQTSEFAAQSLRYGHPHAGEQEIAEMVKARIDRQTRLNDANPPRCWFVLDEAVLRRPVSGPRVMCDQMAALLTWGEQPHITLQVLPFHTGGHAEMGGSLTLFTVPDQPLYAYMEGSRSGAIVEEPDMVAERRESYDLLRASALSPDDSLASIRAEWEDWKACMPPPT